MTLLFEGPSDDNVRNEYHSLSGHRIRIKVHKAKTTPGTYNVSWYLWQYGWKRVEVYHGGIGRLEDIVEENRDKIITWAIKFIDGLTNDGPQ